MTETRWARLGAVSGFVFAVLFAIGVLLPGLPGGGDSETTVVEFYADSGNRVVVIVAAYCLIVAGLAFLVFAAGLHRELRRAEGDSGSLATIALGAAFVFVAMLYDASSAWSAVPAGIEFGGEAQPGSEIPIWFNQLGFTNLLAHGMFAAIALIICTSLVAFRTGVFPRWQAWTGIVCAALLVLAVAFIPMVALPAWVIATSAAMLKSPLRRSDQASRPVPAAV